MEQEKKTNKTNTKPQNKTHKTPLLNSIFVICLLYSRYLSRIQCEVKEWSRFCLHWHSAILGRVWDFFVIQLLKYIKKKKSLNGHTVWMVIQKNRSTAAPLRQKGNAVNYANFHKCNVQSVPLAKWKGTIF